MDSSLQIGLEELPSEEALERASDQLKETLSSTGSRIASLNWGRLRKAAAGALREKLAGLDWLACVAGVWGTAIELRQLAAETKAAPGKEKGLPLGDHSLNLDLHPVLSICCGPAELPALRFTLRLEAQIECAVLIIADGRIVAIEAATLEPKASLLHDETLLGELPTKKVSISTPYKFADGGIEIAS